MSNRKNQKTNFALLILLLSVLICCNEKIYGQSLEHNNHLEKKKYFKSGTEKNFKNISDINKDKKEIKFPTIYIYSGAGLVNGGRLGMLLHIIKPISIEFSYGNDIRNFIGPSDEESRMSFGINLHHSKLPYFISFLTVIGKSPREDRTKNPRYLYSLNLGYLGKKFGFNFLARAGFYLESYKVSYTQKIEFGNIYPNLDVGIGWAF